MKDYMAIINLEENENDIRSLTVNRPIASIPIGSRYRVIDFMLSNLVNSGIKNVGIFSGTNSRSLMDHVGTGKAWDLNRKIDGLFLFNHGLCDFVNHDSKLLKNNMEYIYRSSSENVILASSYMVCNMDLAKVVDAHEESGADMTVVYTETARADTEFLNCYTLDVDKETGRLNGVGKNIGFHPHANVCMEIFVMTKEKLVELIHAGAHNINAGSFSNVIFNETGNLYINTYKYEGFVFCINTVSSYYRSNMRMLSSDVSDALFRSERPIYTKIKDEPPTIYVKGCSVSNSLIADGCVIEGTVRNSVIGRYVNVEKDAVVEDCIILQNIRVHKGAHLSHVIIDKNVDIDEHTELKGSETFPLVIEKTSMFK